MGSPTSRGTSPPPTTGSQPPPRTEAVAAGSPYRYPLWLARALNSAIYDVKWDYESDRAIARIADFYIKIAVFIINLCCCAPFCKYTWDFTVFPCFHRHHVDSKGLWLTP